MSLVFSCLCVFFNAFTDTDANDLVVAKSDEKYSDIALLENFHYFAQAFSSRAQPVTALEQAVQKAEAKVQGKLMGIKLDDISRHMIIGTIELVGFVFFLSILIWLFCCCVSFSCVVPLTPPLFFFHL